MPSGDQVDDPLSDRAEPPRSLGIDYLLYAPDGRPVYLATDGKAERIMHQGKEGNDVLVPLRAGCHSVRVQALAEAPIKAFGGSIEAARGWLRARFQRPPPVEGLPTPTTNPSATRSEESPHWAVAHLGRPRKAPRGELGAREPRRAWTGKTERRP